jgi:predicted ribosomally synthesized peptide with nif11-like leader
MEVDETDGLEEEMSTDSVERFLARLQEDETLEKGLVAAQTAAIIEFAEKNGFDFTVEELADISSALLESADGEATGEELTDGDLEDVAGGLVHGLRTRSGFSKAGAKAGIVVIVTYGGGSNLPTGGKL